MMCLRFAFEGRALYKAKVRRPYFRASLPVNRQPDCSSERHRLLRRSVRCGPTSRLLVLWTGERLVLDMTLMSALAYFVQWHRRRRLAFRNRTAPHVLVESRR